MKRRLAAAALLCALLPAAASAQSRELAQIDSLIARTRLTEARTALQRWQQSHGRRATADDAARALLLRGRLHTNADTAQTVYLEIALGYPSSSSAPEALLRLGQAALAQGEADRAAGYLERLARDYPAATQRTAATLWLARARLAHRRTTEACALLDAAARAADDDPLAPVIEAERRACRASAAPAPAQPGRTAADIADGTATHAIQAGAFRDQRAAHALAQRLRTHGFDARVAFAGNGTLALVRIGSFTSARAATATLRRVRELHRDAVIVDDVARERTSR